MLGGSDSGDRSTRAASGWCGSLSLGTDHCLWPLAAPSPRAADVGISSRPASGLNSLDEMPGVPGTTRLPVDPVIGWAQAISLEQPPRPLLTGREDDEVVTAWY